MDNGNTLLLLPKSPEVSTLQLTTQERKKGRCLLTMNGESEKHNTLTKKGNVFVSMTVEETRNGGEDDGPRDTG